MIAGPRIASLAIGEDSARRALVAFRSSCGSLVRRTDRSGLTIAFDWVAVCDAARTVPDADATMFFRDRFETVQVGAGAAFATGYYEPEIAGSRVRQPGYEVPIYARPADLAEQQQNECPADFTGVVAIVPPCKVVTKRGRFVDAPFDPVTNLRQQVFIEYFDRSAIESGALAGRGLEIAWAADPVEMFFLEVQGSGRLRLPDGSVMRIGYAGQNGQAYTGIGALMRGRGLLSPEQTSMQGIMAVLRGSPDGGRAIMNENRSFVFFRELTGPGPLGALGLPVIARASVAADPAFVPLGAPVFLSMDRAEASGLWVAQDTGGAIKGGNRFDTFWGAGDEARRIAGGMSARGTAYLLLPKGTLARLAANGDAAP